MKRLEVINFASQKTIMKLLGDISANTNATSKKEIINKFTAERLGDAFKKAGVNIYSGQVNNPNHHAKKLFKISENFLKHSN